MKKSISILLAALLLFANIGLAKSSHICMGDEMLSALGFSAEVLDCGMKEHHQSNSSKHGDFNDADECCQNQFELLQSEAEQTLKIVDVNAPQFIFIAAFTHSFILGKEIILTEDSVNTFNTPPLIQQDYTVLFQSFLI